MDCLLEEGAFPCVLKHEGGQELVVGVFLNHLWFLLFSFETGPLAEPGAH